MIRVRPRSFGQSENVQAHGLPVAGNIDCSLACKQPLYEGIESFRAPVCIPKQSVCAQNAHPPYEFQAHQTDVGCAGCRLRDGGESRRHPTRCCIRMQRLPSSRNAPNCRW